MKAQRRHELKTNVLYASLVRGWRWAEENKGKVFITALTSLAVLSVAYLWIHQRRSRPREAWTLLSRTGVQEDLYRKLVEDYSGTKAAEEGELIWAGILYENGRHEEARERLEHLLAEADPDDVPLRARALLLLATLAEQERDTPQAIRLYRRVLAEAEYPGCTWQAEGRLRALQTGRFPTAPPEAFAPTSRPTTTTSPSSERNEASGSN